MTTNKQTNGRTDKRGGDELRANKRAAGSIVLAAGAASERPVARSQDSARLGLGIWRANPLRFDSIRLVLVIRNDVAADRSLTSGSGRARGEPLLAS